MVYEEIKEDIGYFLKLHRLSKAAGMSAEYVVNLLKISNNDLPALENKYKKLQENVDHLESKELDLSITLEELKSQIQDANQRLGFYRSSCQKETSKMLQLHRQNMILSSLLRQFKNNNEEYIKIRYAAKQAVRSILSDSRQLLKLALLSLIESLRADPIKLNLLIHDMPSPLAESNCYLGQSRYTETLMEVIVNQAATLYEKMVKDFANQTITTAAESSTALLPSIVYSN